MKEKKLLKIAFLSLYYGGSTRGAETFVFELSERLRQNNTVEIICGGSKKLSNWPILWRLFLDPQGVGVLLFTLKNIYKIWQKKYDIVIPMDGGWEAVIVRITTWLYGGKVVISGQSGKGWFDRVNILSCPDVFISLSKWTQSKLKWLNPFIKFEYIPNGVDLSKFNVKSVTNKKLVNLQAVLSVGAFTKQKRLDLAINAVSKLKNVSLLLVGSSGDLKEELEKNGQDRLGDRFRILSVPFEKMPTIYKSTDVFTLPSTSSEAFGNVIVEAMATNIPVVVTDDPIRREIVGGAGIFVDPNNTDEYALALKTALSTKWGDKPRLQAEKFSWENIAIQYENLFKKIINKK